LLVIALADLTHVCGLLTNITVCLVPVYTAVYSIPDFLKISVSNIYHYNNNYSYVHMVITAEYNNYYDYYNF